MNPAIAAFLQSAGWQAQAIQGLALLSNQRMSKRPIAWLGNVPLALTSTLTGMDSRIETPVADHPLINHQPHIEVTGRGLRQLNFRFLLHHSFADVQITLDALEAMRAAGLAQPLIWANGRQEGRFLLLSLSVNTLKMTTTGSPTMASVTAGLKQYPNGQTLAQLEQNARQNAPAQKRS